MIASIIMVALTILAVIITVAFLPLVVCAAFAVAAIMLLGPIGGGLVILAAAVWFTRR